MNTQKVAPVVTQKNLNRQERTSQYKFNFGTSHMKKFRMNFDSTKQFKLKIVNKSCKQIHLLSTNMS